MNEFVRMVEALQLTESKFVYTPANWQKGDDVIVPYLPYSIEELEADPKLADRYYSVGNRMWFEQVDASTAKVDNDEE
jgi:peroxiredoxin (alkyl hydroperoxide reductase subunit C)